MDLDVSKIIRVLLATQMEYVRAEREDYSEGMVAVFTADNRSYLQFPEFNRYEEKVAAYSAIVERAIRERASLIVTVNSARTSSVGNGLDLNHYEWGDLDSTNSSPCILITATGPGMVSSTLTVVYRLTPRHVSFSESEPVSGLEVNLLPGWPPLIPAARS